ncbi:MAG: hypothetical protein ACREQL_15845 [Candidatus Binatia bacterium]
MTRRGLQVALLVAVIAWTPTVAEADATSGCTQRYELYRPLEIPSTPSVTHVTVAGRDVAIEGLCEIRGAKLKKRRHAGMVLRKRFKECGALRNGILRMRFWSDCTVVDGELRAPWIRGREYSFQGLLPIPTSTFHTIEDRIFSDRGCAVSTCHGASHAGDLDLRPGAAYASLVGIAPANPAARAAGRLRVGAGDVSMSFLSAKLHGALVPDEGSRMPLGDDPLPAIEIALVDAWIAAGAPQTSQVDGAPELPPRVYEETPPLVPPPGGYQLVLEGPVLQPRQEQEGCLWVPAPTPADVPIRKIEIALNPGTHHFAVWRHVGATPPPLGTWLANDIACLNSGGTFGQQIAGAPHAPYFAAEQPPGFASLLPGGGWYGLNAHYYNESSAPIQIKVWTNIYPYDGVPEHLVKGIEVALDASAAINVPPFTQATVRGRWVNTSDRTKYVMGVGGHMHKRGVRFSIWTSDGTKVLDDYDWAHPSFHGFTPPHALSPGDWLDYECLHDNGVTRPVRRVGTTPATIVFGTSAEDEMCILTGQYYDD